MKRTGLLVDGGYQRGCFIASDIVRAFYATPENRRSLKKRLGDAGVALLVCPTPLVVAMTSLSRMCYLHEHLVLLAAVQRLQMHTAGGCTAGGWIPSTPLLFVDAGSLGPR